MSDHTSVSKPGALCDFCKQNGVTRKATVDGKVIIGTYWANMCPGHHELYGLRDSREQLIFGLGIAQRIIDA